MVSVIPIPITSLSTPLRRSMDVMGVVENLPMGKTSARLHARTRLSSMDMARKWEETFGSSPRGEGVGEGRGSASNSPLLHSSSSDVSSDVSSVDTSNVDSSKVDVSSIS